jgi:excisionase family DNA binding protein
MKTVNEIAKELRVSKQTVYKWVKQGKIKAVKIDKAIRIPESELEAKGKK